MKMFSTEDFVLSALSILPMIKSNPLHCATVFAFIFPCKHMQSLFALCQMAPEPSLQSGTTEACKAMV